ncbi:MAG: hypothetical protein AAFO91_06120, partial [Bacteroidota bacterium]
IDGINRRLFRAVSTLKTQEFFISGGQTEKNLIFLSQMLLSPFRSNQFSASLLLVFYAIALHIPAIWSADLGLLVNDPGASVFGKWLANWELWSSPWMLVVPVMLLFACGMVINRLSMRDNLGVSDTQFPGLFYILVSSYVAAFLPPHSTQFANFFLLLACFPFLSLYKHQRAVVPLFWAGWWLGIAFLVNTYYIIFVLAMAFALPILHPLDLRRILQLLSGWLAPIFLLFCRDYLFDAEELFWAKLWNGVGRPSLSPSEGYWTYVGLTVLGLCLVWVLVSRSGMAAKLQTDGRYKIQVLYSLLLFASLSLLFQSSISAASFQIFVLPLGMLLGLLFTSLERSRAESFHLLLLGIFIAMQLVPFYLRY